MKDKREKSTTMTDMKKNLFQNETPTKRINDLKGQQ
jgi:hypothetical protein